MRRIAGIVLLAAAIVGCGGDDDAGPRSVEEFLDQSPQQAVEVEGFLLIDGDQARLCALIAESYPPQCGGSSILLDEFDPAAVADAVTTEGDIAWIDQAVLLLDPTGDGRATFLAFVGP